uniref:Uncharacterized protein n=1 Tax=Amphimedon queenslandica TaxID=400682 RepID=A0A1X7TRR0_AMPQE
MIIMNCNLLSCVFFFDFYRSNIQLLYCLPYVYCRFEINQLS